MALPKPNSSFTRNSPPFPNPIASRPTTMSFLRLPSLPHGLEWHLPRRKFARVRATSRDHHASRINLNEYMVTLEKPLGIRFAITADGRVYVHALKRGGNAEKSRMIMVGDTLKKAGDSSDGEVVEIKDFGDTEKMIKEKMGSFSLILERPFSPYPLNLILRLSDLDMLYNRGRVPTATWNRNMLASNLRSPEGGGGSGFALFSPKFMSPSGWKLLTSGVGETISRMSSKNVSAPISPIISIFSEEESGDGEWAYGSFPLEEYVKALDRSEGELYYNHASGMRYSKV